MHSHLGLKRNSKRCDFTRKLSNCYIYFFAFQAGGKKGKKVGKNQGASKMKGGKQDMSHLLGFSVSGQGVNRGELDMPH